MLWRTESSPILVTWDLAFYASFERKDCAIGREKLEPRLTDEKLPF